MNVSTLHYLWSLIESTRKEDLMCWSDAELIQRLTQQLSSHRPLSGEESSRVQEYLGEKLLLIRELAQF